MICSCLMNIWINITYQNKIYLFWCFTFFFCFLDLPSSSGGSKKSSYLNFLPLSPPCQEKSSTFDPGLQNNDDFSERNWKVETMVLVGGSTATSHGRRSMSKLIDIKSILIYKVWKPISDSGRHDRQKPNQLKYSMWHTLCKTLHLYTVPTSIKISDYLYMSRFEL